MLISLTKHESKIKPSKWKKLPELAESSLNAKIPGKFVHILDIEGNKIELWEPNDIEYDKIVDGRSK